MTPPVRLKASKSSFSILTTDQYRLHLYSPYPFPRGGTLSWHTTEHTTTICGRSPSTRRLSSRARIASCAMPGPSSTILTDRSRSRTRQGSEQRSLNATPTAPWKSWDYQPMRTGRRKSGIHSLTANPTERHTTHERPYGERTAWPLHIGTPCGRSPLYDSSTKIPISAGLGVLFDLPQRRRGRGAPGKPWLCPDAHDGAISFHADHHSSSAGAIPLSRRGGHRGDLSRRQGYLRAWNEALPASCLALVGLSRSQSRGGPAYHAGRLRTVAAYLDTRAGPGCCPSLITHPTSHTRCSQRAHAMLAAWPFIHSCPFTGSGQ